MMKKSKLGKEQNKQTFDPFELINALIRQIINLSGLLTMKKASRQQQDLCPHSGAIQKQSLKQSVCYDPNRSQRGKIILNARLKAQEQSKKPYLKNQAPHIQSLFPTEIQVIRQSRQKQKLPIGLIKNQSLAVSRQEKEKNQLAKSIKLRQLYKQKASLLERLKTVNSRIENKVSPSQSIVQKSTVNDCSKTKRIRFFTQSHQHKQSKRPDDSYLMAAMKKKRFIVPQSLSSSQKNLKTLEFIKKMSAQTMRRDILRLQTYHKALHSQLKAEYESLSREKGQIKQKKGQIIDSTHFNSNFQDNTSSNF